MDKSASILVTGATGFIGSYILRLLVGQGFTNLSALRRKTSRLDLVKEIADQVTWIEADLLDSYTIHEILKGIDGVIHAAAIVSFNRGDRQQMMEVNITGTSNIVNSCLENQVKKLVHVSSIAVFSRKSGKQYIDESSVWDYGAKNTPYAISKYKAEMEVWRGGSEGLPIAIINPSLVLGSGFWEDTSVRLFKTVYQNLRFYPGGINGFVDVRDVAKAAVILLTNQIAYQRYIISAENLSYQMVTGMIAQALGHKEPHIKMNTFIKELALLQSFFSQIFSRNGSVIRRDALRNASGTYFFNESASKRDLKMTYIPIAHTIKETAAQLLEAAEEDFTPRFLPFN